MARVYLGLGSNIDPLDNLKLAVRELTKRYGKLDLSPVYQSAAVGFDGDDFLNLVAGLNSDDSPDAIHASIERIHDTAGRDRSSGKFGARTLDIDLLLYDDQVIEHASFKIPREDILKYSFVLKPLAELAPDLLHPLTGQRMAAHWQESEPTAEPLTLVDADISLE
jgi:2-amino-4-hydroxy-6-hydroxymethyldihydropteridine diphosphokinase